VLAFGLSVALHAQDAPVRMDPFRVEASRIKLENLLEDNDWFKLMPIMKIDPKTKEAVFVKLYIAKVKKDSPAYEAGLREGMEIKSIQEVSVVGLTKEELRIRAMARPGPNLMRFMYRTGVQPSRSGQMIVSAKRINLRLVTTDVVASRE